MRRLLRPALLLGAVAVITRVEPVMAVAGVLGVWAWIGWRTPPRSLEQCSGRRSVPDTAMFGDTVELELTVACGRRTTWIHLTDMVPFGLAPNTRWVASLAPGEEKSHRIQIPAKARGLHSIGPAVAVTGDTFGLRRVQSTLVAASRLLIYPRIVDLETLTLAAGAPLPFLPTRTPLYDDPTRVVGVRSYHPGDPLRSIHWTASAAWGETVVKKYRPAVAREVVLAVDLTHASHPLPGRRRSAEIGVTTAASVINHLVTIRKESTGLRMAGRDTPTGADIVGETTPGRDERRWLQMLEQLARVGPSPTADASGLLDPTGLGFGTSLVLVTGVLARRHLIDIMRLLRSGIAVTVVLTAGERHGGQWESELREMRVPLVSVARLADLVQL